MPAEMRIESGKSTSELTKKIEIKKINKPGVVLFIFAFSIMAFYLLPKPDMLLGGADATSIWATITSFHSKNPIPSYVLYKGFLSVYPYVWFYNFSQLLGVDSFFFIKLYHCVLFAYIAAVGFPFLISKLLHIELKTWRTMLLIVLLFWVWQFNYALSMLMIDLPSLAVFILCINGALKIAEKGVDTPKLYFVYEGCILGLCMCFSGQYFLSAICVLLYILIKTIPPTVFRDKALRVSALIAVVCLVIGIVPTKAYNMYFEKTVVQPFRDAGEWLPTGKQWAQSGLTRLIPEYKYDPIIPNNRGLAIIKDFEGENFEKAINSITAGVAYHPQQLLRIYTTHPVDNITSWLNRLFLGLSPDNGRRSILQLFVAYTALYTCLLVIGKKCNSIKEFFSPAFLIVFAFVLAALIPSLLRIEMRYMMALQGLIFAVAVLDNIIWDGIKSFGIMIMQSIKERSFANLGDKAFPYTFAIYLIFLFICLMHFAALYELIGADPTAILFTI